MVCRCAWRLVLSQLYHCYSRTNVLVGNGDGTSQVFKTVTICGTPQNREGMVVIGAMSRFCNNKA